MAASRPGASSGGAQWQFSLLIGAEIFLGIHNGIDLRLVDGPHLLEHFADRHMHLGSGENHFLHHNGAIKLFL